MDRIVAIVAIISGCIVIVGAVVGAAVYVSGSFNKARMAALREDNEDLRKRCADMDVELDHCKAREELLAHRIETLENERDVLAELATSRADIEAITASLDEHHRQATEYWGKMLTAMEALHGR